jgi:hypothetical protein
MLTSEDEAKLRYRLGGVMMESGYIYIEVTASGEMFIISCYSCSLRFILLKSDKYPQLHHFYQFQLATNNSS